ncbi:type 1 glutamine amidotransferase [Anthocerotibacter panamensis]|uniref:type 1 glutamine amidotransferase n=1 Tax=Anthocerotibacter panamensis TaxID=2857077 RepID=UPI001C40346C|nr:type 1 glutamine amidotransferase [Anthocerotibacter panamensis]
MTKLRSALKILLLQVRQDEATRLEELDGFVRYSQLAPEQFWSLNACDRPKFPPTCITGYDALFIGGSSDASVLLPDKYPFVEEAKALLRYCLEQEIPVFASCFGFQLAVEALGGKVILDPTRMEIGTFPITLTAAAQSDLLLHDSPPWFWSVCGHKERAVVLPACCEPLATTELCPYHAFRVVGKPFYGFQFHPEMDKADLTARIARYRTRYLDEEVVLEALLADLHDTATANMLIHKFIDRIILCQDAQA